LSGNCGAGSGSGDTGGEGGATIPGAATTQFTTAYTTTAISVTTIYYTFSFTYTYLSYYYTSITILDSSTITVTSTTSVQGTDSIEAQSLFEDLTETLSFYTPQAATTALGYIPTAPITSASLSATGASLPTTTPVAIEPASGAQPRDGLLLTLGKIVSGFVAMFIAMALIDLL